MNEWYRAKTARSRTKLRKKLIEAIIHAIRDANSKFTHEIEIEFVRTDFFNSWKLYVRLFQMPAMIISSSSTSLWLLTDERMRHTLELGAIRASALRHSNDRLIGSRINIIKWYDARWSSSMWYMHQTESPGSSLPQGALTFELQQNDFIHSFEIAAFVYTGATGRCWNSYAIRYICKIMNTLRCEGASEAHAFGKHSLYSTYSFNRIRPFWDSYTNIKQSSQFIWQYTGLVCASRCERKPAHASTNKCHHQTKFIRENKQKKEPSATTIIINGSIAFSESTYSVWPFSTWWVLLVPYSLAVNGCMRHYIVARYESVTCAVVSVSVERFTVILWTWITIDASPQQSDSRWTAW